MRILAMMLAAVLVAAPAGKGTKRPSRKPRKPVNSSPEHIAELIKKLDGPSMKERMGAMKAYAELKRIGQPALPQLRTALKHSSPWVRLWSLAAVADAGDVTCVGPALKMARDPLIELRKVATHRLGRFYQRDKRIPPALVQQLADPDEGVREKAEGALAKGHLKGAGPALQKMLRSDSRLGRMMALELLLGPSQDKLPGIRKAVKDPSDWRIRSAGVCVLGLGLVHANEDAFDLLLAALDDPSNEVKADAVEVLDGVLGQVMQRMPDALRKRVLGELTRQLPALVESKHPALRGWSLYLLAAGQREKLYPRAIEALDDPSPEVRVLAFRAVSRIGRKTWKIADKALANMRHTDAGVRSVAFATLRWSTGGKYQFDPRADQDERAKQLEVVKKQLDERRGKTSD